MALTQGSDQEFLTYVSEESKLEYRVLRASQSDGIKTNIVVLEGGERIYSDNPNLSSAKSRTQFVNKFSKLKKNISSEDVEKDLLGIEFLCYQKLNEEIPVQLREQIPVMTEEERQEAISFLKKSDLIPSIQSDINTIGLVGEEINSLTTYIVATSRIMKTPLSGIVKGSSSAGKSELVKTVMKLIPREGMLEFAYMSPKALGYMDENGLKNKVLVIYERPGAEASDYQIRIMQSEHKLRVAVTIKDPTTGEFKTQDREVSGPMAYIETTTSAVVHPENETRTFSLYVDESEDQTRRIQERQRLHYNLNHKVSQVDISAVIQRHHNLQRLIKHYRVLIPYIDLIEFSSERIRSRRDFPRFLSVLECITLLHQFQREIYTINGQQALIASVEDYKNAYELSKKLFSDGSEIPPKSKELFFTCKRVQGELRRDLTMGELARSSDWSKSDIKKFIEPLLEYGFMDVVWGRQGKEYKYKILKDYGFQEPLGLITPDNLMAQYKENEKAIKDMIGGLTKSMDSNF